MKDSFVMVMNTMNVNINNIQYIEFEPQFCFDEGREPQFDIFAYFVGREKKVHLCSVSTLQEAYRYSQMLTGGSREFTTPFRLWKDTLPEGVE